MTPIARGITAGPAGGEQSPPAYPALLALGFRPFFLLAGLSSLLLMAAWIGIYVSEASFDTHYGLIGWHAHEMLFGYTAAVIAGFLLTAAHNWTGAEPLRGWPLGALIALWLAGRIAPLLPASTPGVVLAAIDMAFFPALAACLSRTLRGSPRRMMFLAVVGLFTLANGLVHAEALGFASTATVGRRLALDLILMLISMIGGWVFPAFTERGVPGGTLVRRSRLIDRIALAATGSFALAELALGDGMVIGAVAAVAAIAHGVRLQGWYDRRIWSVPLLWVLHTGYAWLAIGFALRTLVIAGWISELPALHAFTAGAIGVLTLGMMARVSLGHTGRPLRPHRALTVAFVLANLAALWRVSVCVLPAQSLPLNTAAGGAWVVALLIFVVHYAPILVQPRVDGRPG